MAKIKIAVILSLFLLQTLPLRAEIGLKEKLSGRFLLQTEKNGEAWYIYPNDNSRYYLGRPADAWEIMRRLGTGISNADLRRISVGLLDYQADDSDQDGLPDRLEEALGTDPLNPDTDGDGYSDKEEILSGYDPLGPGRLPIDNSFAASIQGRIFIQVENQGEAWYINPLDQKRYYLGRPADAWIAMRYFSLGISDQNLDRIPIRKLLPPQNIPPKPDVRPLPLPDCPECGRNDTLSPTAVLQNAANAIRSGSKQQSQTHFTPGLRNSVAYTLDFLNPEARLAFSNILTGARLKNENNSEAVFENQVYFNLGGYQLSIEIKLQKQTDGNWLISQI